MINPVDAINEATVNKLKNNIMQVKISTKSHMNREVWPAGLTFGKHLKITKQLITPLSLDQKNNFLIVTIDSNQILVFNNRFNDSCTLTTSNAITQSRDLISAKW